MDEEDSDIQSKNDTPNLIESRNATISSNIFMQKPTSATNTF